MDRGAWGFTGYSLWDHKESDTTERLDFLLHFHFQWQIDGETMETVRDFIFLGSRITADGGCSHEIKIHLLLGRKAMTNLDNILKSRDITLPTKVHLIKAMVFQ